MFWWEAGSCSKAGWGRAGGPVVEVVGSMVRRPADAEIGLGVGLVGWTVGASTDAVASRLSGWVFVGAGVWRLLIQCCSAER